MFDYIYAIFNRPKRIGGPFSVTLEAKSSVQLDTKCIVESFVINTSYGIN